MRMMSEKINTLVVGGGQAGLAMSEHLSKCEVPHLVLERGRIAERWRSGRWDSLVANGPAWHDLSRRRSRQLCAKGERRRLFSRLREDDPGPCPLRGRGAESPEDHWPTW